MNFLVESLGFEITINCIFIAILSQYKLVTKFHLETKEPNYIF